MGLSPAWGRHGYLLGDLGGANGGCWPTGSKKRNGHQNHQAQEEERSGWPGRSTTDRLILANLVLRMEICERLLDQDVDKTVKELGS